MLAKKPAERYQTAADVIAALEPWVGASSHVMTGLSRTKIGQNRQSAIGGWSVHGSSGRLGVVPRGHGPADSGEFDFSDTGKITTALSSSETARSPTPTVVTAPDRDVPPEPLIVPLRRSVRGGMGLVVGVALGMLVAGVLIGWLAFGR